MWSSRHEWNSRGRELLAGLAFLLAGLCTASVFLWLTTRPSLTDFWFEQEGKFIVPTLRYWMALGGSMPVALAPPYAVSRRSGLLPRATAPRRVAAALLALGSVPIQVLAMWSKRFYAEDLVGVTGVEAWIAGSVSIGCLVVWLVMQVSGKKVNGVALARAALIVWFIFIPLGIFALLFTMSSWVMTRRWRTTFLLASVGMVLLAIALSGSVRFFIHVEGVTDWPMALPLLCAMYGYSLGVNGQSEDEG